MKTYRIKSPSGKTITVFAESFYHAINMVMGQEGYIYQSLEYFKLNK
jgi:hypothetical protein